MEPVRHHLNRGFDAVIFRRTYPQIMQPKGLWDQSWEIYPKLGAKARESSVEWRFPKGATVRFRHMNMESDRYQWDGAQIAFIGFDELEHFTHKQFFYLLSRNRSMCGIKPYVRGTTNPDPDHWCRSFMSWWIDDDSGLAIRERSGIVRWFVMEGDEPDWADTREELVERYHDAFRPKSF